MPREYKRHEKLTYRYNDDEIIRVVIDGDRRKVIDECRHVNNGDQRTKTSDEGIHRHFDQRKKNFDGRKHRLNDGESGGLIDKRRHYSVHRKKGNV